MIEKFTLKSALALTSLLLVAMLWDQKPILMLLLAVDLGVFLKVYGNRQKLMLFIVGGIAGVCAEMIAIYFGAWYYASPDILGIPLWLFLIWGMAALYIVELNNFIGFVLDAKSAKQKS